MNEYTYPDDNSRVGDSKPLAILHIVRVILWVSVIASTCALLGIMYMRFIFSVLQARVENTQFVAYLEGLAVSAFYLDYFILAYGTLPSVGVLIVVAFSNKSKKQPAFFGMSKHLKLLLIHLVLLAVGGSAILLGEWINHA